MRFKSKAKTWWCKVIGWFKPEFMTYYWTTVGNTVYFPTTVKDPTSPLHTITRMHEAVHIEQFYKLGTPLYLFLYLLFPLPIFFSYFRWRFEREAYLTELRVGATPEQLADALWTGYFWPWPRSWMRKWFEKHA